jgi:hypothetical protein
MAFQWLQMRISEEKDRRQKEQAILERLPGALEELHRQLSKCIESYVETFGEETADIQFHSGKIRIVAREERNGQWETAAKIEIVALPAIPGFKVDRGKEEPLTIEVGLLPSAKLSYRQADQYLTMEEMTRRILDRALFPRLKE